MTAVPTPNPTLDAALRYADRGWRVIPLHDVSRGVCSCSKAAACGKNTGKHPRIAKWPDEATVDSDKIAAWWRKWPAANIGIAMGGESRLVALDIDPRSGGYDALDALAELPPTLTARTGSGGEHRIFRVPDSLDLDALTNTASVIGTGLDLRTTGGQIVVEPSVSPAGSYRWIDFDAPIADLPLWLYKLACKEVEPDPTPRPAVQISTSTIVDRARKYIEKIDGAISGSRGHPQTFKVAIALVRGFNLSTETALVLLREYNEKCQPKWSEKDLRHKIDDAAKRSRAEWGYLLRDRRPQSTEDTGAAYRRQHAAAPPNTPTPPTSEPAQEPDGRHEITVSLDLPRMVDEACRALATLDVYQRGRRLVCVARGQYGLESHIIGRGYLVELLTKAARWIKIAPLKDADVNLPERFKVIVDGVECKRVEVQPPANVVQAIFDRTTWPYVRELDALAEAPFLRPDGTVCQAPGYDDATRTLYQPSESFPFVPDAPCFDEVLAARDQLLDVICDFPWVGDVDRSTWLAGVLTMLARPAIDGPTPVFVVTGNGPGAGKTLACKAAVLIATGRDPSMCAYQKREDEQMKTVASQLLAARPAVIFDNVDCQLGSPTLNLLWTTTAFEARLLSTNEAPSMPARTVWWASGNNVFFYRDTPRRVALMRMQADEAPEKRQDFRHTNLLAFVRANRAALVVAALTVLRGHAMVAPRELPAWGSYEAWSKVARSAVVWTEMPDPNEGRVAVDDDDLEDLIRLHAAWSEMPGGASRDGISVPEVLEELATKPALYESMRTFLADAFDGKPPTGRHVGNMLRRMRDRVANGAALVHAGRGNKGARWTVRHRDSAEPRVTQSHGQSHA